jgi:hypothetical protein
MRNKLSFKPSKEFLKLYPYYKDYGKYNPNNKVYKKIIKRSKKKILKKTNKSKN